MTIGRVLCCIVEEHIYNPIISAGLLQKELHQRFRGELEAKVTIPSSP